MVNKSTNTEKKVTKTNNQYRRTTSARLKERNVGHRKVVNIRELDEIYTYGERLGKGVFGTVIEITEKQNDKVWALKIVDKTQLGSGSKTNTIENEMKILRMVNHPHIIYLDRTFESVKHFYLVIERCTTDLSSILRKKKVFTNEDSRRILDDLTNAVAYLHKHDIVHRDLKMENILIAPNPNDVNDKLFIKVSDFGLGIVKTGMRLEEMLTDRCGTAIYMAPEIISRASYNHQCDVWSMGIICFLLLTGTYPFFHTTETYLNTLICNYDPITNCKFNIVPEAKHLLSKMLEKNPALRISAAEANQHAWIKSKELDNHTVNVLDMMQLWRDDMKVPTESTDSSWAQAFSSLEAETENSITNTIVEKKKSRTNAALPELSQPAPVVPVQIRDERGRASLPTVDEIFLRPLVTNHIKEPNRALNVAGRSTKFIRIGKVKL